MSELTLDFALQRLYDVGDAVDTEALQVLRDQWEEALPLLLLELSGWDEETPVPNGLLCATVLLSGELKETRTFEPLIESILHEPEELYADLLVTQLGGVLANCSDGDRSRLLAVYESEEASRFARICAFQALVLLLRQGDWAENEFKAWLASELEKIDRGEIWEMSDYVIVQAVDFLPEQAGRVGTVFFEGHKEEGMGFLFDLVMRKNPQERQKNMESAYKSLGTADEEFAEILQFYEGETGEDEMEYLLKHPEELLGILPEPDEEETELIPAPDIGRNESCPCGSGKKFKKCCINKPFIAVPRTAVDWMGKPITEQSIFPNSFMEAGYLHEEAGDLRAQVASWIIFAGLLEYMVPKHITYPGDIERKQIFRGCEQIDSWMGHFLKSAIELMLIENRGGFYVEYPVNWLNDQFVKVPQSLREQMKLARGFLYAVQEDKAVEAIRDFRQVLEWRPDNYVAISMLASLYQDRLDEPDIEAAQEVLEQGLRLVTDETDKARFRQQLEDLDKKQMGQ